MPPEEADERPAAEPRPENPAPDAAAPPPEAVNVVERLTPPYPFIARALREGLVVPFLGAGVNFGNRRPPGARWSEQERAFLPSGAELSRYLADQCSFPSQDRHDREDLAKVSSFYVDTLSRRRLRQSLRRILKGPFEVCDIHTYLASVAAPLLVVTTNYDNLTEKAFDDAGRPYDLVIYPTDQKEREGSVLWRRHGAQTFEPVAPNRLHIDLRTTTVIYKMHGTVYRPKKKWDSYVITEEDYVDFLSRMTGQAAVPAIFMNHFRNRHFLFLGYGLRDWNLRVVLRNLRAVLPSKDEEDEEELAAEDEREEDEEEEDDDEDDDSEVLPSWAIQFRPTVLEEALWRARRVIVYDQDINEFVARLRQH